MLCGPATVKSSAKPCSRSRPANGARKPGSGYRAAALPEAQSPQTGYAFEGFRNPDGSVGVKNILAISTVQYVVDTLEIALKRIKAKLLPHYPNVDDVVAIKVSTRAELARRWSYLIDFDAGRIGLHNDLVLFNPAP